MEDFFNFEIFFAELKAGLKKMKEMIGDYLWKRVEKGYKWDK